MSKYVNLELILHVPNIRKVYEYNETGEYITYLAIPLEVLENAVEHKGFCSSECEQYYTCSSCKYTFSLFQAMKYCPNCGAKIDLEEPINE